MNIIGLICLYFSRPESLAASSVSDSLTLITAMNEDESSRTSMPVSILTYVIPCDPPPIDSTLNAAASGADLFISSRPDPATTSRSEDVFEPNAASVGGSVELEASAQELDDSHCDDTPVILTAANTEDGNLGLSDSGTLLRPIVERSHLSSSDSSSSASQEVNEIFESQNRPGHRSDGDEMLEDEDETLVKPSVSQVICLKYLFRLLTL